MLANCISAGHENCATAAFIDGVLAMKSGIEGAIRGGMLNEAKMVILSRRQKREYETLGIWGPVTVALGWHVDGDDDPWAFGFGPKILAKRASLYTQIAMLTVVVVMNFAGPGVTVS